MFLDSLLYRIHVAFDDKVHFESYLWQELCNLKLNQFSFSVLKAVKLTGDFVKSNQEMFNFSKNNQHFFFIFKCTCFCSST